MVYNFKIQRPLFILVFVLKLAVPKENYKDLLDLGIIEPSPSEWSLPLHMVKKKNGEWRPELNFNNAILNLNESYFPIKNVRMCCENHPWMSLLLKSYSIKWTTPILRIMVNF